MREDGFFDIARKVERFFTTKKNVRLTQAEIDTLVRALQSSDRDIRSISPDRRNEFDELLEYVTKYQDAMTERKKQKIVRFLTQKGLKCSLTRKCK